MTHFYFNIADLVDGTNCWTAYHRWKDVSWKVASRVAAFHKLKIHFHVISKFA